MEKINSFKALKEIYNVALHLKHGSKYPDELSRLLKENTYFEKAYHAFKDYPYYINKTEFIFKGVQIKLHTYFSISSHSRTIWSVHVSDILFSYSIGDTCLDGLYKRTNFYATFESYVPEAVNKNKKEFI